MIHITEIEDLINHMDQDGPRVELINFAGKEVFIKRYGEVKTRPWHKVQLIFSKLIPIRILRTTVSQGGVEACKFEAKQIRRFLDDGLVAAEIIAETDSALATKAMGPTLDKVVSEHADMPEKQIELLSTAARALAKAHRCGRVHGRPKPGDLFVVEEKIGFLDFEEKTELVMPQDIAQARDVWLFLAHSATLLERFGLTDKLSEKVAPLYLSKAPEDTLRSLKKFVRILTPLLPLAHLALKLGGGKDIHRAVAATSALKSAFANR